MSQFIHFFKKFLFYKDTNFFLKKQNIKEKKYIIFNKINHIDNQYYLGNIKMIFFVICVKKNSIFALK